MHRVHSLVVDRVTVICCHGCRQGVCQAWKITQSLWSATLAQVYICATRRKQFYLFIRTSLTFADISVLLNLITGNSTTQLSTKSNCCYCYPTLFYAYILSQKCATFGLL